MCIMHINHTKYYFINISVSVLKIKMLVVFFLPVLTSCIIKNSKKAPSVLICLQVNYRIFSNAFFCFQSQSIF